MIEKSRSNCDRRCAGVVKRDDYTKNIVDFIYERLLRDGRLGQGAIEAYEKSQYWKEALREYKETNGFTYRKVAQK